MKESYKEGLATHLGPESCAGAREGTGEALARVRIGRLLSSEITVLGCRPRWLDGKATRCVALRRELRMGPTESKTPRMCGNSMHENREIPREPAVEGWAGRLVKDRTRTTGMQARGKSDKSIVPMKPPNKDGQIIRWRRRRREGI